MIANIKQVIEFNKQNFLTGWYLMSRQFSFKKTTEKVEVHALMITFHSTVKYILKPMGVWHNFVINIEYLWVVVGKCTVVPFEHFKVPRTATVVNILENKRAN